MLPEEEQLLKEESLSYVGKGFYFISQRNAQGNEML